MIGLRIGFLVVICLGLLSGCATEVRRIPVDVASVRVDLFSDGYATVGVVEPETQVDVVAKHAGTVAQTFKEVGDVVSAGEPLLQLDPTTIRDQLKSNQAALEQTSVAVAQAKLQYQTTLDNALIAYETAQITQQQAQTDYDHTATLFAADAIAKTNLEAAQTALDKANAALETAQTALAAARENLVINSAEASANAAQVQNEILTGQMAEYTVTSPIDGVIIKKNASAGGMIGQNPVYAVAELDRVIISTAVPKEEINKLTLGGQAQVFYPDNSSVETRISALSNAANASNLYLAQVTVDNQNHSLKPGMNAGIVFTQSQNTGLIVPFNAVVSEGKNRYLFLVENDTAKKVFVNILGENPYAISLEPIDAVLSEGAQIVTTNANLLKDGDLLTINKED